MTDPKPSRSLAGIAGIVAIATLISKLFGLVREQAIAAAYGIGPVVNAYAYAYIIPGFLLILLGGINGPFHSALISVLAKRDKTDAEPLVETITTLVSGILLIVTIFLVIFAGNLIDFLAPGLDETSRAIAIQQLQIMAPLAICAGLVGIGFGVLNAADLYWLPSISPLFSSITVILGVGILYLFLGPQLNSPQYLQLGGLILAGGTLAGGILQWLVQLNAQWKAGLGKFRLRFDWHLPGVKDVIKVMVPATLSSGMLHINVYTDLFFASFIENAAATMRYANFIVQTPLGIISNTILVPLLPIFSRLAVPESYQELKGRIRQGLMLTALTMLPLTAIFMSLAYPIVKLIYERGAFNVGASDLVAPVLMTYGFGMFFYLGRDVLVRVFYALGDGETPFRISIFNIFLNGLLDWLLYKPLQTPGLILATIIVNIISLVLFLIILHKRLHGLPLLSWGLDILKLIGITVIAGISSWGISWSWEQFMGYDNLLLQIGGLAVGCGVALGMFSVLVLPLKLPEVAILVTRIQQKLKLKK